LIHDDSGRATKAVVDFYLQGKVKVCEHLFRIAGAFAKDRWHPNSCGLLRTPYDF
jgi:hypothetical protein